MAGSDGHYLVNGHYTCPDAKYRPELHKGFCKHRLAVYLYLERRDGQTEQEQGAKEKGHG